ncbi:MAG: ATP-binding protein [Chloroflexaceae bacterium]|nr:ATP-binding protein [Chloroflexaceae bacterium]
MMTSNIEIALRDALPIDLHPHIPALARVLTDALTGKTPTVIDGTLLQLVEDLQDTPLILENQRISVQATTGDQTTAPHAQGFIYRPTGPVLQVFVESQPPPFPPFQQRQEQLLEYLPQRIRPFVGREGDLAELELAMKPYPASPHHMITIKGVAGVGKTELVLEFARRHAEQYCSLPDNERFYAVVFASAKLKQLTTGGIVLVPPDVETLQDLYRELAQTIQRLDILKASGCEQRGLVLDVLRSHRVLIILDNLDTIRDEHLAELHTFLKDVPAPTKIILTTRHTDRHELVTFRQLDIQPMPGEEARKLVEVEAQNQGIFQRLSSLNIEKLAWCTRGLPLAIVWSIGLIADGRPADRVIRRLDQGHSDLVRFCFEESVERIQTGQNEAYCLLLALALFEVSVSRQVLGNVAGIEDEDTRDASLSQLKRLSLINQENDEFTMLPLTRTYIQGKLEENLKLKQELVEGWVRYCTTLVVPYRIPRWLKEPDLDFTTIKEQGKYLAELANWAHQENRFEVFLTTLPALSMYYFDVVGDWTLLENLIQVGLSYAELHSRVESTIYIKTHPLRWLQGARQQFAEICSNLDDALQLVELLPAIDAVIWRCDVLRHYAVTLRHSGAYQLAEERCAEALQEVHGLPGEYQSRARAGILLELGKVARDRAEWGDASERANQWQVAEQEFRRALQAYDCDDTSPETAPNSLWWILIELAYAQQQQGILDSVDEIYQGARKGCEESGDRSQMTKILHRQVELEVQRSEFEVDLRRKQEHLKRGRIYAQEGLQFARKWAQAYEQTMLEKRKEEIERCIEEIEGMMAQMASEH